MYKTLFPILVIAFVHLASCSAEPQSASKGYTAERGRATALVPDSSAYLVADSVLYDVLLINPDTTDQWASYCLRKLDVATLADQVFEAVYAGRLQAYQYVSDEPLTIDQVRQIEAQPGNERTRIAKIQFEEQWHFDPQQTQFIKRVVGLMLAYEIKADEGRFRAGIKVRFPAPPSPAPAPTDSLAR